MILNLVLVSKRKNVLLFFIYILNIYFQKSQKLTNNFRCHIVRKNTNQVLSLFKSPHVNKKAKKKFIYFDYKTTIVLSLSERKKLLFLYKLFCLKFYIDLNVKVLFSKQSKKNCFKNFTLKSFFKTGNKTKKSLLLLDSYGENLFI